MAPLPRNLRRSSIALLFAGLLAASGLLLPMVMSHPASSPTPGERHYAPDAYLQAPLFWSFNGPRDLPAIDKNPCDNTDLVYGRPATEGEDPRDPDTVNDPDYPGDEEPHEQQTYTGGSQAIVPHIAHIYGGRYLGAGPWDMPQDQWVWIAENSSRNYHLDSFENPRDLEGEAFPDTVESSVMAGTDGFFDFHFGMNVTDADGTEAVLVDFHPHASYCLWAKPYWDETGPWLFVGSAFINQVYDWNNDTLDDFLGPGENAGASEIDLELFYEGVFRQQYSWWPQDQRVEAYHFMVESSLDKYPAARAWFTFDVTPFPQQQASALPPGQKDNGELGIIYSNSTVPQNHDEEDYIYKSRDLAPMVQEHWVMLEETARRFGWPERDLGNIRDATPDPIYAWEWYIDSDPRPFNIGGYPDGADGDTSDEFRDCPSPQCNEDFPFPNPLRQRELPQEFYLDDSSYIDTDGDGFKDLAQPGEYTVCLIVYTEDALTKSGVTPDWITGRQANADSTNWDRQCKDITVINIPPVAYAKQEPKWHHGDPHPRTRTFWSEGFDPDGVPRCLEEIRWDFDGEYTDFSVVRTNQAENAVLNLPAAQPDVYGARWTPEHTFEDPGLKKVSLTVQDCNGGVSEPASFYVDIPPNQPPYLDPIEDRRIQIETSTCFWVVGHDPDGYPLVRTTHDGAPDGMTPADPPTGADPFQMCWRPTANQIGTHTLRVWTEDDMGAVASKLVTIQVYDADLDSDDDGIIDLHDLCPGVKNSDQADLDGDGVGDACDADKNGDGVLDEQDGDGDGLIDTVPECRDGTLSKACIEALSRLTVPCPDDPALQCTLKVACIVDATRCSDKELATLVALQVPCPDAPEMTCYLGDVCPGDAANTCLRKALPAADRDGDGIADTADNCPTISNPSQRDFDLDTMGDACDPDLDGDGIAQTSNDGTTFLDNCPDTPNADQADLDDNGIGDACETLLQVDRAALAARPITASDCTDCTDVAQTESRRGTWDAIGTGGVVAMVLAGLIVVGTTVGLTTWSIRRWRD